MRALRLLAGLATAPWLTRHVGLVVALSAGLLSVGQVVALEALPNSTSTIEAVSDADLRAAPEPAGFRLGSLWWDLASYRAEPRLEPMRTYVRARCEGLEGVVAATCLSNAMAAEFPHGNPPNELFDAVYDPAAAQLLHSSGVPGHCVTRSGLLAAMLVSVGVPARVLQLVRRDDSGHTLIEVWDGQRGWLAFDPSFGAVLQSSAGPLSSLDAGLDPGVELATIGVEPAGARPARSFYAEPRNALAGTFIYPEPWLYLRVGPRVARWPLRGAFASGGHQRWRLGPAQALLRVGAVLAAGVAMCGCLVALRGEQTPRRPKRATARLAAHATAAPQSRTERGRPAPAWDSGPPAAPPS